MRARCIVVLACVCGCGQSEDAKVLLEFEQLATHVDVELTKWNGANILEHVTYDVKRTDSLVRPYEATINFVESDVIDGRSEHTVAYAYQNGKWIGLEWKTYVPALLEEGLDPTSVVDLQQRPDAGGYPCILTGGTAEKAGERLDEALQKAVESVRKDLHVIGGESGVPSASR